MTYPCVIATILKWYVGSVPKDHLRGLILSFLYVRPRDGTPVIKFGDKSLYPLSHLTGATNCPKEA